MGPVMLAWMVEIGVISVRDFVAVKRPPLPSELLATFVVFGGLGVVSESPTFRGAAGTTAWGIVVATLLSSKVDFLKPVGDFFAGTTGAGPTFGTPAADAQIKSDTGNITKGLVG